MLALRVIQLIRSPPFPARSSGKLPKAGVVGPFQFPFRDLAQRTPCAYRAQVTDEVLCRLLVVADSRRAEGGRCGL